MKSVFSTSLRSCTPHPNSFLFQVCHEFLAGKEEIDCYSEGQHRQRIGQCEFHRAVREHASPLIKGRNGERERKSNIGDDPEWMNAATQLLRDKNLYALESRADSLRRPFTNPATAHASEFTIVAATEHTPSSRELPASRIFASKVVHWKCFINRT